MKIMGILIPITEIIAIFAMSNKFSSIMNVKLHTPSTLKSGSGIATAKQFLLSLIATTISIVLTFGTAAIIDYNKKQSAKKEMVMMVICDFDKTIEFMQKADTALREASSAEQELALHPEKFNELRSKFIPALTLINENYTETTEKIFSTSIETFSTIGNVNFVNEVSSFYGLRSKYKNEVLDRLRDDVESKAIFASLKSLLNADFPEYSFIAWSFLHDMKAIRDNCMVMMGVTKKDLIEFSEQQSSHTVTPARDTLAEEMQDEFKKAELLIMEARERFQD